MRHTTIDRIEIVALVMLPWLALGAIVVVAIMVVERRTNRPLTFIPAPDQWCQRVNDKLTRSKVTHLRRHDNVLVPVTGYWSGHALIVDIGTDQVGEFDAVVVTLDGDTHTIQMNRVTMPYPGTITIDIIIERVDWS